MKTILAMRPLPILVGLLAFTTVAGQAAEPNQIRARFREVDTPFANPGQGWMSQQRSPRGEPRFPCSVVYIRFNWADVEPEEGRFNWIQMKWANVGVGKLHRPYALRLFLLDAAGQPALNAAAKADPRDWLPGARDVTESLPIPSTLEPGEYILAVALVDPSGSRPFFRLAIDATEKQGRSEVSQLKVE